MNTLQMKRRPSPWMTKQPAGATNNTQNLIDCHAAEHLLVGTHSDNASSQPSCLTCQLGLPISA